MSSDKVRLGIVGCGMATMVMYTPIMRYVDKTVVTALCDPFQAALDRAHPFFPEAATYLDYDEFLRAADVDAVIVATPVYLHREQVVKAARAGKHVMCEKPMSRTIAECDEMIAACEEAGVTLMVGFMKRFDKSMRHAKVLIEEGRLGTIHNLVCDWRGEQPGEGRPKVERTMEAKAYAWRAQAATWGGRYQDIGSHTTDLSRWWMGDINVVSGEFSILRPGWEVDDSTIGVYLHEGGARSVHQIGLSNKRNLESYQIDGSKATLEIQYGPASHASTDPFQMTLYEEGGRHVFDETRYNDWVLGVELAASGRYKREIDHFCECVLEGKLPMTTGQDGRKAIEAINAVYLSAFLGEKIHLPLEITPDFERLFAEMGARSLRFA